MNIFSLALYKLLFTSDLQFSSEEDLDDTALSEGDPMPDDDSQQAAEAMVQLGNMGYYPPAPQLQQDQGTFLVHIIEFMLRIP